MKLINLKEEQTGAAAFLTVVIITAAALVMACGASLLGIGEMDMSYKSAKGEETISMAESCADEVLYRIKQDSNYTPAGNLPMGNGSCIINITADGQNREIHILAQNDKYYKRIKIAALISGEKISILSWDEISE